MYSKCDRLVTIFECFDTESLCASAGPNNFATIKVLISFIISRQQRKIVSSMNCYKGNFYIILSIPPAQQLTDHTTRTFFYQLDYPRGQFCSCKVHKQRFIYEISPDNSATCITAKRIEFSDESQLSPLRIMLYLDRWELNVWGAQPLNKPACGNCTTFRKSHFRFYTKIRS